MLNEQRLDSQQIDGQGLDNRRLDSQQIDDQRLDGQELDDRRLGSQRLDGQELDGQEFGGQELNDQRQKARRHLLPHFTAGRMWRDSDNMLIIERGDGCYVWDTNGNRYLDGLSGLFCTNLGHGRSDLAEAAAKQMNRLSYYPNWSCAHPSAIEAASLVAGAAPGDLDQVFFVNSGSEAIESALKFARCYHLANGDEARRKVIARRWAYHGTTLGALAVTGIPNLRSPYEPLLTHNVRHVANTLGCTTESGRADQPHGSTQTQLNKSEDSSYRTASESGQTASESGQTAGQTARDLDCVRSVEEAIQAEGPETVSVVIAEPVQNGRGALVPPTGYWQELRRICDEHGVLLCADEVINSFGRLGYWFGSESFDVVPDMITFAKGVTSAYQPLGGLIARSSLVEQVWDSPLGTYLHGSTFGGHPVATSVAVANINAMRDENVFENVRHHQDQLGASLRSLMDAHQCVKDVRGMGYFYAIELTRNRHRGLELTDDESQQLLKGGLLQRYLRAAGVLIRPDDRGATMLSVAPPLVADSSVIADLVNRIDQVLNRTNSWLKNRSK